MNSKSASKEALQLNEVIFIYNGKGCLKRQPFLFLKPIKPIMDAPNYWRGCFSGIIATYVMTVAAQWVRAVGLPPADPSRLMAYSFGQAPYLFGLAAHFMNGIILGLMYAHWRAVVPGHSVWMRGITVGIVSTLAAQLVVGPLVRPSGFLWQQPQPLAVLATSAISHLVFGLVLVTAYEA